MRRRHLVQRLLPGILFALAGCGGGGQEKSGQTATVERSVVLAVHWPTRSRLIPQAAQSVLVEVRRGSELVSSAYVDRPDSGGESRIALRRLPPGELTATASAHPQSGGRGVAQASGSARVNAEPGVPFTLTVEIDSTIDHIEVTSDRPSVFLGDTLQLSATAYDRSGNVVLVGDTWRWRISGSGADVDERSGTVTGRGVGTSYITVRETESGVEKSVSVRVKGVARIDVQPASVRILDDQDIYLTAIAYDSDGQVALLTDGGWTWSVGTSNIARLFGGGAEIRVGGLSVGHTEITVYTLAGGSETIPVTVYPSHVSGSLSVDRSGYTGASTLDVTGDGIRVSLDEGHSSGGCSLSGFDVDDSRLVLVELNGITDDMTDDDYVDFTLDLSGPTTDDGKPFFVFADGGGTSVSGTLTRADRSTVFRLIVRDPITGETRARSRAHTPKPTTAHRP